MKSYYLGIILLFSTFGLAQNFDDYFSDATLRLDYIFAGNATASQAYIHNKTKTNHWYGRKKHLAETPIQGHAAIKVYDAITDELIYILPFGSLFQEWQTTALATQEPKSFEQSFLIPFPKEEVKVVIDFYDKNREPFTISEIKINPSDILIQDHTQNNVPEYKIIHSAEAGNPVRIAFVAEGYQLHEHALFYEYAEKAVQHFFHHEVFNLNRDKIEFIAVPLISEESGVSNPSEKQWKNTALHSHFDTFYSNRYLTTSAVHRMHEKLENVPYQHIIILVNTATYGGGGILNSYSLTTTLDHQFDKVVVHEFGHSFAGLADEYFYPDDMLQNKSKKEIEPWEKNITTLVDFNKKWKHKVKDSTPIPTPRTQEYKHETGAYEGLEGNGLYIPTQNCRMQTNDDVDFCDVCSDAIQEMIDFHTD